MCARGGPRSVSREGPASQTVGGSPWICSLLEHFRFETLPTSTVKQMTFSLQRWRAAFSVDDCRHRLADISFSQVEKAFNIWLFFSKSERWPKYLISWRGFICCRDERKERLTHDQVFVFLNTPRYCLKRNFFPSGKQQYSLIRSPRQNALKQQFTF